MRFRQFPRNYFYSVLFFFQTRSSPSEITQASLYKYKIRFDRTTYSVKKVKPLYRPKWPMGPALSSGFLSMKRLGVLLSTFQALGDFNIVSQLYKMVTHRKQHKEDEFIAVYHISGSLKCALPTFHHNSQELLLYLRFKSSQH